MLLDNHSEEDKTNQNFNHTVVVYAHHDGYRNLIFNTFILTIIQLLSMLIMMDTVI